MGYSISSISPKDTYGCRQLDALLEQEGIRRDRHLDYMCGLYDEEGELVATGSAFGNTLRCLAVDKSHQGEGLLNTVLGHLMELQAQKGNTHVFLYTKEKNLRFFESLGFHAIVRVNGVAFLENRRDGFARCCETWKKESPGGASAAVVMNANPFTLGHLHLLEEAARENEILHLFLLSENAGPIPYEVRRRLVREGTAHIPNLVLHSSGSYLISLATFPSYFLSDEEAAVRAHAAVDLAIFGKIAGLLDICRRYVGEEPASRITSLYNEEMAAALPAMGIECRILPRLALKGETVSASTVRAAIHDDRLESIAYMLPESPLRYFNSEEATPVIAAIKAMAQPRHA